MNPPAPLGIDVPDPLLASIKKNKRDNLAVEKLDSSSGKRLFLDFGYESSEQPAKRPRVTTKLNRVACKARGMSDTHNGDTAYFEVPASCRHGQILICSHAQCAASGRRFRYCAVCALPVAKRNFMKRHAHGLVSSPKELDGELEESPVCGFIDQNEKNEDGDSGESDVELSFDAPSFGAFPGHRRVISSDENTQGNPISPPADATPIEFSSKHDFNWLGLLHRRSTVYDQGSMNTWMNTILEHPEESSSLTPEQNSLLATPLLLDKEEILPSKPLAHISTPEFTSTPSPICGIVTPDTEKQLVDARHLDLSASGVILTDIDFTKIFD